MSTYTHESMINHHGRGVLAQLLAQLSDTIHVCRAAGADFTVARLESIRAKEALERSGIITLLAAGRLFHSVEEAIQAWRSQSAAKDPVSPNVS